MAKAAGKELRLSWALGVLPKGVFAEICFWGSGFATRISLVLSGRLINLLPCYSCACNPSVHSHRSPLWLRGMLLCWCSCSRIIYTLLSRGPCPDTCTSHCHIKSSLTPGACRQALSFDPESVTAISCKMILGLQDDWAKDYWAQIHQVNSVPHCLIHFGCFSLLCLVLLEAKDEVCVVDG